MCACFAMDVLSYSPTTLRRVISNLDVDGLLKLLTVGRKEEEKNVRNVMPIFIFICQLEMNLKKRALQRGIDPDRNWTGEKLEQCLASNEKIVNHQPMSNRGISYNLQRYLVEKVFEKMFKLLVEYGCNINEKDINDRTALHHAVKYGLNETMRNLVELGAEIEAEARVSSWIQLKLPVLYHSLYMLDLDATRLILQVSTVMPTFNINDVNDFIFIPCKVPTQIQKCLMGIQEINPLTFLLFIFIIKSYGDKSFSDDKITRFLDRAVSFRSLLDEVECSYFPAPECLINCYRDSAASLKTNGFCEGKFFFQLVKRLFKLN